MDKRLGGGGWVWVKADDLPREGFLTYIVLRFTLQPQFIDYISYFAHFKLLSLQDVQKGFDLLQS